MIKLKNKLTGEVSEFDTILLVKNMRNGNSVGHLEYDSTEELNKVWLAVGGN